MSSSSTQEANNDERNVPQLTYRAESTRFTSLLARVKRIPYALRYVLLQQRENNQFFPVIDNADVELRGDLFLKDVRISIDGRNYNVQAVVVLVAHGFAELRSVGMVSDYTGKPPVGTTDTNIARYFFSVIIADLLESDEFAAFKINVRRMRDEARTLGSLYQITSIAAFRMQQPPSRATDITDSDDTEVVVVWSDDEETIDALA